MARFFMGLAFGVAMVAFGGGAAACDSAPYDHNGSLMEAHACDGQFVIAYDQPRAGLAAQGVRSGTVLFRGVIRGNRLSGTAHVFKAGCPPAPYPVRGSMGNNVIVLEGVAPVRQQGCAVTGARNDRLVFNGQ